MITGRDGDVIALNPLTDSEDEKDDDESSGGEYHSLADDDENEFEHSSRVLFLLHSLGLDYWAETLNWNNINLDIRNNLPLNYWNHLNLNLRSNLNYLPNLPNINLRSTSLWKFYENGVENLSKFQNGLTNLGRPDALNLDFSESLDLSLEDIFISSKKGIKDPVEKFHFSGYTGTTPVLDNLTLIRDQNSILGSDDDEEEEAEGNTKSASQEEEAVILSEEFWSSIFTATTEGCMESAVSLPIPGTQTIVKAPINPFFHRIGYSIFQNIKMGVGAILVPIRVILVMLCLILASFLAWIATRGLSVNELQNRPLKGWRRVIRSIIAFVVMRTLFFFVGFYWVKKKGRQASRTEAPILAVAPHSSFFDAFPLIIMGAPSIVSKSSVANVPFFGKLVDLTQAVYVTREVKASRSATLNLIKERATSNEDWPQVYIYPEGTCTNRSSLVSFKLGAFYPGVPVQPVIIRYPNKYDTITWTFDGLSWSQAMFRSFAQFILYIEIEYLPVHIPSPEEINDPQLFANNVRQEMAEAMGVPTSDYTYEDGITMTHMNTEHLVSKLKEISRLRNTLTLSSLTELNAVRKFLTQRIPWWVNLSTFTDYLGISSEDSSAAEKLYNIFVEKSDTSDPHSTMIDIREYFVFSCLLNHSIRVDKIMPVIFLMYAEGQRKMSMERFVCLMKSVFEMTEENATEFFKMGNDEHSIENPIDLDKFGKKLKKRLEYLRLYALEANGLLHVYPPRDQEISTAKLKRDKLE